MAQKMKAALVHEFGKQVVVEEIDIPELPEGQVLVKVVASGVCHTDLHAAEGDWPLKPSLPFIPGHEGAGFVAGVVRGVKFLKEGDRVGVPWLHTACGHCEHCFGDWVAVSGIGGLGPMAVQYAKAMGFHVIAVDIADDKLALAKSLGAELTLNAATQDVVAEVKRHVRGAHGVLVTAVSRAAFAQAVGMLHKRGTMSLVGLPPGSLDLPIFDVVLNARTVRGSIICTRPDLQEALQFAGERKVRSRYSTDKIDNINAIFGAMKEGRIDGRVVLEM